MRTVSRLLAAGLIAGGLAACSDQLVVNNPNAPDEARALARPTDVENLIVGSFNTMERNITAFNIAPEIMCLGLENYSNLANNAMAVRSTIPRPPIANTRNATGTTDFYNTWVGLNSSARAAALGLSRAELPTFTFFPTNASQVQRAIAFANFAIGVSLGQIAMVYDSGAAISDQDNLSAATAGALIAYDTLARYALARLDSAVKHTAGMGTLIVPQAWMSTTSDLTPAQFRALILGWKARIMAGVARSASDPVVNWDTVLNDANLFLAGWNTAGSNGDVVMVGNPAQSWSDGNMSQLYQSNSTNWHEMHGFMIGMADTSGQYQAWLNASGGIGATGPYQILTPDLRFPQGGATCNTAPTGSACRTAQQGAPGKYIWNRPSGTDWFGETFGNSNYIWGRWQPWFKAAQIGNLVIMSRAEIRLLAAEANYNKGNYAAAAGLVDSSRVGVGGLPSLVTNGITNATATLPGPSCVPRVPAGSGAGFTTSCGTLLEALKWEKRMETAYTWGGSWYFDSRRWGDLPVGTALFYPVPYPESDARNTSNFYGTGGSGPTAANKGTYGL